MDPAIVQELDQIKAANAHNDLVAEEVVAFAANPTTRLHDRFEWDDSIAGHKYRLVQARNIIRVVVEFEPHTQRHVRAYVSLESTRQRPGGGYDSMNDTLNGTDTQAELLDMALKELNRVREKYHFLSQLANVFNAIQAATTKAAQQKKGAKKKATKKKAKKKVAKKKAKKTARKSSSTHATP